MDQAAGPASLDPTGRKEGAVSYGWDEITLPSVPRGDADPPPWVSSVQPGEAQAARFLGSGLLFAVLVAGLAGTLVGLFILGS